MLCFRLFLLALVAFLAAASVLATAQIPDRLRYDGREYLLYSEPLEQRYGEGRLKKPGLHSAPFSSNSALERGYIATWEIRKGRLYLVDIESWVCAAKLHPLDIPCRRALLEDVLGPEVDQSSHFAGWFTGELRVPQGRQLVDVHLPYLSVYERDMIFRVRAGVVDAPVMVDNTKKPLPEYGSKQRWATPLGSFDIASPPVPLRVTGLITPGLGLGQLSIGATQAQVQTMLGPGDYLYLGEHNESMSHVDHAEGLIQIRYDMPTKTVAALFFNNRLGRTRDLRTDRGIGFAATQKDVLSSYGQPVEMRGSAATVDLCYPGIEFRFEKDRLMRIAIVRMRSPAETSR